MTRNKENKTLLFGGSFDPIHVGHLITASYVKDELGFREVYFITAGNQPFKEHSASAMDRYCMVKMCMPKGYKPSPIEISKDASKKIYTIDTVKEIQRTSHGRDSDLYWLIGEDNITELEKWYRIEELASLVTFVIMRRISGRSLSTLPNYIKYKTVSSPRIDISSTDIRKRIKEGDSIKWMVTPEVERFIEQRRLYL